jgi:hypothetical protein
MLNNCHHAAAARDHSDRRAPVLTSRGRPGRRTRTRMRSLHSHGEGATTPDHPGMAAPRVKTMSAVSSFAGPDAQVHH